MKTCIFIPIEKVRLSEELNMDKLVLVGSNEDWNIYQHAKEYYMKQGTIMYVGLITLYNARFIGRRALPHAEVVFEGDDNLFI